MSYFEQMDEHQFAPTQTQDLVDQLESRRCSICQGPFPKEVSVGMITRSSGDIHPAVLTLVGIQPHLLEDPPYWHVMARFNEDNTLRQKDLPRFPDQMYCPNCYQSDIKDKYPHISLSSLIDN